MQRKLTLSHLLVTLISVLVLAALVWGGYRLYLRTNLAARWAGDEAAYAAEEISWQLAGSPLTPEFARDYIREAGFSPVSETDDETILYYENWMLILAPDGTVIASNDETRYPEGSLVKDHLPGWNDKLQPEAVSADFLEIPASYAVVGEDHIGQAAILSADGTPLGWVYLRFGGVGAPYSSRETLTALAALILGAGLIALLVSGIVGGRLARSFSGRLQRMSQVSAALAAGDLSSRVPVEGEDEIAQLGRQFNLMADQISAQVRELRQLAERNALLAEEARGLAAVEERNRLARELHDALKQQIFALSLSANAARTLLKTSPAQAAERLAQLEEQASEIHLEMDAIIRQLRPASLGDRGLGSALREWISKWQNQHQIRVSFRLSGERELPLNVEHALFRVSQEALNNVARHARADAVEVVLEYGMDEIHLRIRDNGQGFDPEMPPAPRALGLRSMRERIAEIGGALTITSTPGAGTTVDVVVPTG